MTHICVGNLTIIASNNYLSPGRLQAIIWTNAGLLLIGPLGTNFSEILIEIITFSFKKMSLKVSSAKWRPFCLGLNVSKHQPCGIWLPLGRMTMHQHWLPHVRLDCWKIILGDESLSFFLESLAGANAGMFLTLTPQAEEVLSSPGSACVFVHPYDLACPRDNWRNS